MIGLTRLYCYKGELFRLVDVCSRDASDAADALRLRLSCRERAPFFARDKVG